MLVRTRNMMLCLGYEDGSAIKPAGAQIGEGLIGLVGRPRPAATSLRVDNPK